MAKARGGRASRGRKKAAKAEATEEMEVDEVHEESGDEEAETNAEVEETGKNAEVVVEDNNVEEEMGNDKEQQEDDSKESPSKKRKLESLDGKAKQPKLDSEEDEEKKQQEELERKQNEEAEKQEELERKKEEAEKQEELERKKEEAEKQDELERKQKEEAEKKLLEEQKKKEEEEMKRKKEEEKRLKAEERKRKEEEKRELERKKKEEEKRLAEERKEQERLKKKKAELEKYWKPVKDDPTDFTGWTYLLQYVDQENNTEAAREAFDEFFTRYPYCYGYWKKYADYEKKKGTKEKCEQVFDRGLKAIPLSVDLWVHYTNYLKTKCAEDEGGEEKIRSEYQRAIETCGMDFRSSKLWEQFIKWETEKKNPKAVFEIYVRLLQTPTQMYSNHWTNFQKFVNSNHPKDILSVDDFLTVRKDVLDELRRQSGTGELLPAGHDEEAVAPGDDDEDMPPGEEDEIPGEEKKGKSVKADEEIVLLREKVIEHQKEIHKANEEEVSKRWAFEEGVKRPYFHVKPLEKGQLKNWRDYLDFEIEVGDENRIMTLFERCLIACAFYEEYWHKYIQYLSKKMPECESKLRDAFTRACSIHLPKKPALHLQWAAFEEKKGDYEAADRILQNLEKNLPDLLQLAYRRVNLARREGRLEKVHELYKSYQEKVKADLNLTTHMTVKYARFCHKVCNNVEKAKEILTDSLEKVAERDKGRIYIQLVDLGFSQDPVDEGFIVKNLDAALECAPTDQDRLLFSQRKVEFLEDFGSSISRLQDAIDSHLKLLKTLREQETKRRAAEEEPMQTNTDTSKSKKSTSPSPQKGTNQTGDSNSMMPQWNYNQNWNQYQGYGTGWNYGGYYNQGWGYNYPPPANQNYRR